VLFTLLNVLLAVVPTDLTIVMHATKIKASITAYSTAVGPSSLRRNLVTRFAIRFMGDCPSIEPFGSSLVSRSLQRWGTICDVHSA
jgi:hypothetical protein